LLLPGLLLLSLGEVGGTLSLGMPALRPPVEDPAGSERYDAYGDDHTEKAPPIHHVQEDPQADEQDDAEEDNSTDQLPPESGTYIFNVHAASSP
jgi:hypothetical protein